LDVAGTLADKSDPYSPGIDYNNAMNNEPLILLHGWGMNAQIFEPLLGLLDAVQQIASPGLPGYSGSPWPGNLSFELQLEAMARELPDGRLLGWSLGGLYAIELALRYPQQFSEVILVACNPCFTRRPGWECALDAAVLDTFADELKLDRRRTMRRFLALQMQGEDEARQLVRSVWQQMIAAGEPDSAVLNFGLELLKNWDARPSLGQLTQPVNLILGERDRLVPIALQQQIADVASGIQVESVAGAAHAPFLSNPAVVAMRL
jgi:pimeloyl-[acyl-carrier protein] methyl ester esterase